MPYAIKLLPYKGRPTFRYPVEVSVSNLSGSTKRVFPVISQSPLDAADLIQREFANALDVPFEVTVYGPKGGVAAYRFTGYERLIGLKITNELRTHTPPC